MRVVVGSQNPVKVSAVEEIFKFFYRDVEIIAEKPKLSVSEQPFSLKETLRGALERAYKPLRKYKANLGVGIEAGFIKIPFTITGFLKLEICCIVDNNDYVTVGFSSAFEFPPKVIESLLSGKAKEAEEVMEKISGIKRIGEKMGAIGFLTKGLMKRKDLTKQAVLMAIIPRVNNELYNVQFPRIDEILNKL